MKSSPANPSPAPTGWSNLRLLKVELVAAMVATLTAVIFHWLNLRHAGALWRDEAAYVQLANLPSWSDLWQMLTHDHSPVLMPALLRIWCSLGGQSDFGLRLLGCGIGLLLLAAFWFASRSLRRGYPLFPLAFVAVNALVIRYGDSLRGYGLGCVLCVLMVVLVWRATRKTTVVNVLLAALAAVLSVQALYQNAVFVLAACCGGMVVGAVNRRWRDAAWILAVGSIAALSLVPYIGLLNRSQDWWILSQMGFDPSRCWNNFSTATGFPFPAGHWLWILVCLYALWLVGGRIRTVSSNVENQPALFGAVALVVGVIGFVLFIRTSKLPTQDWYYVPLLCFAAVCVDGIFLLLRSQMRPFLALLAMVAAVSAWVTGLGFVQARQTNLDLVAAKLATVAAPGDCILVHPWYCGISFSRYYHGITPWLTLPPLDDYRFYRYDLLKSKLQENRPVDPVINRMFATLKAGHRVWVVGNLNASPAPLQMPNPAPNNPWGWFDLPYADIWGGQVGYLLMTHGLEAAPMEPLTGDRVNPDENEPVTMITGWKD